MSKLSAIGGAVISVVSTTAGLIGDTRALLYTDKDFARLYTMMKGQAVEYADLQKKISPVMEQQQTRAGFTGSGRKRLPWSIVWLAGAGGTATGLQSGLSGSGGADVSATRGTVHE